MKNMLFRCEHMISKSVLNTGIFEKLREIASMYYFNFAILIHSTNKTTNKQNFPLTIAFLNKNFV